MTIFFFSSQVAPSVRAPSQLLGAPLGSDVQLNCQVEASPSPVTVRKRSLDSKIQSFHRRFSDFFFSLFLFENFVTILMKCSLKKFHNNLLT